MGSDSHLDDLNTDGVIWIPQVNLVSLAGTQQKASNSCNDIIPVHVTVVSILIHDTELEMESNKSWKYNITLVVRKI